MDFELLMMMLLQTLAIDSVASAPAAVEATTQSIGLLDLLIKGGYMMIPLYVLFVLAIFIFVQKLLVIKKASKTPGHLMDQVKLLVQSGQVEKAKMLCAGDNTPVANMISKGIDRIGSPLKNIEVAIENVGKHDYHSGRIGRRYRSLFGIQLFGHSSVQIGASHGIYLHRIY